jgi:hypothetical protein
METGLKLWVFLLASIAVVGTVWVLWSRFIGMPHDDPTGSRPPDPD